MEKLITNDIFAYEIIAQALSNKNRLKILNLLKDGELNINDISKQLNMPMPTVTVNIQKLEESGLIICKSKSGKHGKQKICSLKYKEINLRFFDKEYYEEALHDSDLECVLEKSDVLASKPTFLEKSIDVKIGSFTDYNFKPECGIASRNEVIMKDNIRDALSSQEKMNLQVIWFNDGFVSYEVPFDPENHVIDSIKISFEACSEHMFFNNNWPSDISLWLNDYELGTYTSEGYFGDKGIFTPDWWFVDKPQHGEFISYEVNSVGTIVNDNLIHPFTIKEIKNLERTFIIKIGINQKAKNARGIMIFGEEFGNYNQNIKVQVRLLVQS